LISSSLILTFSCQIEADFYVDAAICPPYE